MVLDRHWAASIPQGGPAAGPPAHRKKVRGGPCPVVRRVLPVAPPRRGVTSLSVSGGDGGASGRRPKPTAPKARAGRRTMCGSAVPRGIRGGAVLAPNTGLPWPVAWPRRGVTSMSRQEEVATRDGRRRGRHGQKPPGWARGGASGWCARKRVGRSLPHKRASDARCNATPRGDVRVLSGGGGNARLALPPEAAPEDGGPAWAESPKLARRGQPFQPSSPGPDSATAQAGRERASVCASSSQR